MMHPFARLRCPCLMSLLLVGQTPLLVVQTPLLVVQTPLLVGQTPLLVGQTFLSGGGQDGLPHSRQHLAAEENVRPTNAPPAAGDAPRAVIGAAADVGCGPNPRRLQRLAITEPGVYENILVDGEWVARTLVKINADNVTLRNCEIRNGMHNAVTVYAQNVLIESCKIHHVLAGSYGEQRDAHGITGRPTNLTIRNCDIGLVSGDAVQFDPGRRTWDDVLIENCTLWTGPLPADAAGFKQGERPGENAVDTKQRAANPRSRLTIRNCLMYGWNQPGQITNMAALNLKNHVRVHVENCVFRDNELCFRLRGVTGEYGGAQVTIDNCAVYDSQVAVRAERGIRDLKIRRLGVGSGVQSKLVSAGGGAGPGFEIVAEYAPPPFEDVLRSGLSQERGEQGR